MPVLEPDTQLQLPSVTVLRASAGSGKTYALTERFVQFLLSTNIPRNDLCNILAITFSNNASREMREKVLEWLKLLSFKDKDRLTEIATVVAGFEAEGVRKAGDLVEEILSRYSDFQVKTIDSFMSAVFRASALDFGYGSELEIVLDAQPLLEYAFNLFLRDARQGTERAGLLDETVRAVLGFKASDDAFSWDPAAPLLSEITGMDERLALLDARPRLFDPRLRDREELVRSDLDRVARLVEASGFEPNARSTFPGVLASARAGRFSDLIGRGMKMCPVKKPMAKDPASLSRYEEIQSAWEEADAAVGEYTARWARAFYQPALRLHAEISSTVEKVKRSQGKVFIGDIGRALGDFLDGDIVPDVYFRIGERIWHFLMDEFQDTSPLQWRALYPLVENSLAMGGSLFVVGDTKQAIYGFRKADYTIMRSLESGSPFPSAGHTLRELATNRRSRPRVLSLVEEVIRRNAAGSPDYREAARRSGLDEWTQTPLAGEDPGYAEVEILARDDEDPPEKAKIRRIMEELKSRGYGWGDIALLASRNEQIVRATSWLNELGIPFISFSSLDVRSRRIAGEILSLLSFLDSPPDDLSFAAFLLGDIFGRTLAARGRDPALTRDFLFRCRSDRPLYKAFQRDFPELWRECFAGLFRSTGYLPLYDLVSEAFARFSVFSIVGEEEATLAKLLETVKEFEGSGSNSLREFLGQAGGDAGEWAIDVPRSAQSVQAMTIHKAKGLGFPVVILLLYGDSPHGFAYTLLREGENATEYGGRGENATEYGGRGENATLVKITQDIAKRDPSLKELYDEERVREKVDRLNGLYVALSRARRELYVIGVKHERDTFPFDLLPSTGFAPSADKGAAAPSAAPAQTNAPLSHETRLVPLSFDRGKLGREERRRGELAHRMLELLGEAPTDIAAALAAAGQRAAREARLDPAETAGLGGLLLRMVRETEAAAYFAPAPGRIVLTEQEFCDKAGRLFRMDRVVVDLDAVTVIDFKTGAEDPAAHEAQLRDYRGILADVYPGRSVAGLAAYIDLGVTRRIG